MVMQAVPDPTLLELTLRYATGLKKVNLVSKMDIYAVVSISRAGGDILQTVKTPPDHQGGSNPTWDFLIRFTLDEAALREDRLMLDFKLVCDRALGDKDVGQVHVSVKELFDSAANGTGGGNRFVSYQVTKPSGRPKGQLTFSYKFSGETPIAKVHGKSVTVDPAVESKSISLYPPSVKLCEERMAIYPAVELISESIYPRAKVYREPTAVYSGAGMVYEEPKAAAYPTVELNSNSMYLPAATVYEAHKAAYPAVKSKSNSLYSPAATKAYEEPTAAYLAAELQLSSVYTSVEMVHKEPAAVEEFVSNSVYPPSAKGSEESTLAEFISNPVYSQSTKVYDEAIAMYQVAESKSISVYPPAIKAYEEPTAAYSTVKLDSSSFYPSVTTERLYPPPCVYQPPDPFYVYLPPPPLPVDYAYPLSTVPQAPRNNKFGVEWNYCLQS